MTAEEIIEKLKDIHPSAFVLDDDIKLYYKYTNKLKPGSNVVDVGTGLCKSIIALALSNEKCHYYTYDNGEYPIQRNWSKNKHEYELLVNKLLKEYQVINSVNFYLEDILSPKNSLPFELDLFHMDAETPVERLLIEKIYPRVNSGGYLLLRNSTRFDFNLKDVCPNCHFIEYGGRVQVLQKK